MELGIKVGANFKTSVLLFKSTKEIERKWKKKQSLKFNKLILYVYLNSFYLFLFIVGQRNFKI